jgi:hypothetical protein
MRTLPLVAPPLTPLIAALALLAACGKEGDPADLRPDAHTHAPDAGPNSPDAGPGALDASQPDASEPDAAIAPDPCIDPIEWSDGPELPLGIDHTHTFTSTLGGGPAFYVVGGQRPGNVAVPGVYRAAILEDGSLGAFEQVGLLPEGRSGASLLVQGRTVILAGGGVGPLPAATVVVGRLDEDGNLSEWAPGPSLPGARFHSAGAVVGDTAYVTGGVDEDGEAHDSVFIARLVDGTLGAWEEATPLPAPRTHHGLFVADGALFVSGGLQGNAFRSMVTRFDDLSRIPLGLDGRPGAAEVVRTAADFDVATHAVTLVGRCFLIFAGGRGEDFSASAEVQRFGLDGERMGDAPASLPDAFTHLHQVPYHDGHFYAAGARLRGRARPLVWVGTVRR